LRENPSSGTIKILLEITLVYNTIKTILPSSLTSFYHLFLGLPLNLVFGKTRLRGRPRNRWQGEVKEDGRIVGGEGWQERVHNREKWKKFLRTARKHRILHVPNK